MNSTGERLLDPKHVPSALWDEKLGVLYLSSVLAQAYGESVHENGLRELADKQDSSKGPVGGLTKELTDEHFAKMFDGSVARAMLAILDPYSHVGTTSDMFIRSAAGNSLCLTDAPCGAAAASLSFLCTVAELRRHGVLPRLPLHVCVVGAEISEHARRYAEDLFRRVKVSLEEQAIFITPTLVTWDVTDTMSNTSLIKLCEKEAGTASCRLLVVANFNGFLEASGKRKDAAPQLEELFRYASGDNSWAVWIEPSVNSAIASGGLFDWLKRKFAEGWRLFGRLDILPGIGDGVPSTNANFEKVLHSGRLAPVRLSVMPISLKRPTK